jgi:hypothetical protein
MDIPPTPSRLCIQPPVVPLLPSASLCPLMDAHTHSSPLPSSQYLSLRCCPIVGDSAAVRAGPVPSSLHCVCLASPREPCPAACGPWDGLMPKEPSSENVSLPFYVCLYEIQVQTRPRLAHTPHSALCPGKDPARQVQLNSHFVPSTNALCVCPAGLQWSFCI